MKQVKQYGVTGGNAVAEKMVDFHYNSANEWTNIQRYADLLGTQWVATGAYTHDETGRLTNLDYSFPTGSPSEAPQYEWAWDEGNRITQFRSWTDRTIGSQNWALAGYTNDVLNQLTNADYTNWQNSPNTTGEDYDYDANGNRTNNEYQVGYFQDNQMTASPASLGGTYAYVYDYEGNRQARFKDNDYSSTLTDGDTDATTYVWDHRNRLKTVTHFTTYDTDGGTQQAVSDQIVDYKYDNQNRWIYKKLDPDGSGGTASIHQTAFVYDGNQIALQFDKSGTGLIQESNLTHRYLWGAAVDQILADEIVDNGGDEDVLWTLGDNLNTVRDLATFNPGNNHTTVATHRVFDAFGKQTYSTPGGPDTLMGYTGKPFDGDIKEQNNINRWYEAGTGKWLSTDPIGFKAEMRICIRYVGNNTVMLVDILGYGTSPAPSGSNNVKMIAEDLKKNPYCIPNMWFVVCTSAGSGGLARDLGHGWIGLIDLKNNSAKGYGFYPEANTNTKTGLPVAGVISDDTGASFSKAVAMSEWIFPSEN